VLTELIRWKCKCASEHLNEDFCYITPINLIRYDLNKEPRDKPRGIKSESGKIIRRKRREIDPEEINILMKNKFYELGEK
jgi:hypothetical protein